MLILSKTALIRSLFVLAGLFCLLGSATAQHPSLPSGSQMVQEAMLKAEAERQKEIERQEKIRKAQERKEACQASGDCTKVKPKVKTPKEKVTKVKTPKEKEKAS